MAHTGVLVQATAVETPHSEQVCGDMVRGLGASPVPQGGSGEEHTGCPLPPQAMHAVLLMLGMKLLPQSVTRQVPVVQVKAVPLAMRVALQGIAQPPQCDSVLSVCSQPLAIILSQLPRPLLQVMRHAPLTQVEVPPTLLHAIPQPPQCSRLVLVLTQPAPMEVQSVVPVGQVATQAPAEQRVPEAHTRPQEPEPAGPQLLLSVSVLVQVPAQSVWPEGHTHVPDTHV